MLAPQGGALPYDAEVEYLESTGTQYINTGLVVTPTLRMDVDMAVTDWDASQFSLTGAGGIRFAFGKGYSGSSTSSGNPTKLYFGLGDRNLAIESIDLATIKGERHTFSLDAGTRYWYFDGVGNYISSAGTITTGTRPIMLLAQSTDDSGSVRGQQAAKLYGATFTDNGVVVRSFAPVRVGSGAGAVGYLFDRVSGELFGNAGTGNFPIGPDK
jgi:hypothetical protein